MVRLGFRYREVVKSFYTDTHEKEGNVRYRKEFSHRYLFVYEPYMLRYIQVSVATLAKYLKGKVRVIKVENEARGEHEAATKKAKIDMYEQAMSVGKAYGLDGDTDGMVEFHVDSIADPQYEELHQLVHEAEVARNGLGCNQSVFREDKDRKILIGFGQDEVINKQFIMNKKAWHNS